MSIHRLVPGTTIKCIPTQNDIFSAFDFIEVNYGELSSLRRLFSLARSHDFKTLTIESIPEKGIIEEENHEIRQLYPDYSMKGLQRLAFWNTSFKKTNEIKKFTDDNLIGYAILKLDQPTNKICRWHVFESVLKKYSHKHNCIPHPRNYEINIAGKHLVAHGIMYCQQNQLNKCCAHVALRAILDGLPTIGTISYRRINRLAGNPTNPGRGLGSLQIQNVLNKLDIQFRAIDYTEGEVNGKKNPMRKTHPYRKFVYSGVESGLGSLLGFHFAKPGVVKNKQPKHIIRFFSLPGSDLVY